MLCFNKEPFMHLFGLAQGFGEMARRLSAFVCDNYPQYALKIFTKSLENHVNT
jgi:hypothetical protein